ncbi:MAG: ABC transporter substrate-binding protein [Flavisolibacter sp.]
MAVFIDQLNREVILKKPPSRIISLVPSQTELLFALGLDTRVVGITKFCVHPAEWFHSKTRVGGTKDLNLEKIFSLEPDIVIANKEENIREQIEAISQKCPVWVSDVNNLEDAVSMIHALGEITETKQASDKIIDTIRTSFIDMNEQALKTCYLIWQEPFMTVGSDTFIHDMMQYAGFQNVFRENSRYPAITLEDIRSSECQLVLLSSEPYPFNESHAHALQDQLPGIKILLADGEMFSWYGSRLMKSPAYFKQLRNYL